MRLKRIIHVAQIELRPTTGMGRIACEWRAAVGRAGIEFIHLGDEEVGPVSHRLLFPPKVRRLAENKMGDETLLLIHEPCAWAFRNFPHPKVAFSHGIEMRGAEITDAYQPVSLKSRLFRPFVNRLARRGLKAMDLIIVSNTEDRDYLLAESLSLPGKVKIFRNGVDPVSLSPEIDVTAQRDRTVIFGGSWLKRKGTETLVKSAMRLAERGIRPHWLLIGTGTSEAPNDWPPDLRPDVTVVPDFPREDERSLLAQGAIFVLPSYFEGQPLALLQAMAMELCCISTNNCGQKDLIRSGENGLLFPPGDAGKLADCIQQALENQALRTEWGCRARVSIQERTWPAVSDEIIGWLQELNQAHPISR